MVANTAGVDGTVADFALAAVWPNPARRSVRVQFALPREATVHLGLHDVQGREVAALADGTYPAGRHTVDWSAAVSPPDPGLYFLRLTLPGLTLVRRFVLVK